MVDYIPFVSRPALYEDPPYVVDDKLVRKRVIATVALAAIALIAAVFGFGGIAAGAAGIAKILFIVFLIGAVVSFLMSVGRRA